MVLEESKGAVIIKRRLIGVAQIGTTLADVPGNVERAIEVLEEAASREVDLVVFPECNLSGYAFGSLDEARVSAITTAGPELRELADASARLNIHSVVGYLEREGDDVYNSVALIGPGEVIGSYRKIHLPCLAADRFVTQGDYEEPPVFETPVGRIGLAICYDLRFPESARSLALAGAEIIAQPTNSVSESSILFDHFSTVRAAENRVFIAFANRPDTERELAFVGRSQILSPAGERLVEAGPEEGLFVTEIDLESARNKSIVFQSDEFELHVFADRRPELYGEITERGVTEPPLTPDSGR